MSLVSSLADAIQRKEGWYAGSRSYRNNNPGNMWDGIGKGKTVRIWPSIPIDDQGFLIYPTYAAGRAALEKQLNLDISRGLTIEQLISKWAPPSENDTAKYIADVVAWTGIPTGVQLATLGNQVPAPGSSPPFPKGQVPQAPRPGQPSPRAPKAKAKPKPKSTLPRP